MKRPPTMREVMSHSAGFGYGLADEHPVDKLYREKSVLGANGLADMIKRTADIPLMYQPGTRWSYSSAVDIQGYIVEKLSGQRVRRVPAAADLHAAEDGRHGLLRAEEEGDAGWLRSMSAIRRPGRSRKPETVRLRHADVSRAALDGVRWRQARRDDQ